MDFPTVWCECADVAAGWRRLYVRCWIGCCTQLVLNDHIVVGVFVCGSEEVTLKWKLRRSIDLTLTEFWNSNTPATDGETQTLQGISGTFLMIYFLSF